MVSDKITSNAIGAKTARPCDGCAKKRARWYCAADDAFLCQACDSSVHSANQLARRHERVRLKTASNKAFEVAPLEIPIPSWHRGLTKKARTPRHGKPANHQTPKSELEPIQNSFPLVPEINFDETSVDENEEQLLYRVPIYDPFLAELCTSTTNSNEAAAAAAEARTIAHDAQSEYVNNDVESKAMITGFCDDVGDDNLHGFLPSDMDLAEFAADVESLLGRGLENESFGIEELGLIECKENNSGECSNLGSGLRVKVEEDEEAVTAAACHFDMDIDLTREPFELNFDYDSPATGEEEEEKVLAARMTARTTNGGEYEEEDDNKKKKKKKNKLLRLNYEGVITAWGDSQRSPWTTGIRPDLDECWPDFMVSLLRRPPP